MWELAEKAIQIEKSAQEGCSLCYELFVTDLCEEADYTMRKTDPTEKRFFATLLRANYVTPDDRGEDWQSSYELSCGLWRELYGDDSYDYEIGESKSMGDEREGVALDWAEDEKRESYRIMLVACLSMTIGKSASSQSNYKNRAERED